MPQLSMIPGWDGLHPMIIHFPIVLFVLAPLFLLFAAFTRTDRRSMVLCSALILMVLATISLYLAFETGGTAGTLIKRRAEITTVVEHHQEFADLSRSSFTAATALFSLVLLIRRLLHLHTRELTAVLPLGFVAFYGLGLFWLIHTAYNGERLVHEFGVKGVIAP
ncbi:MAG TPA: DUF2231 domain-containing protein [Terriglobales bacterium]|jgi:uncharacterized membrane protein